MRSRDASQPLIKTCGLYEGRRPDLEGSLGVLERVLCYNKGSNILEK